MKLLLENWRKYLNERVYGNLITVYSRTTSEDIIAKIASEGWKVGSYGDYGPAIYMQYSFEPSDYADRTYGTHVMKFALQANNKLLILGDKEAAKKAFGKELSAEEQLKLFAPESLKDKSIVEWVESTRRSESFSGYAMPVEKLKKYINGILLVNRKDGRVAIIYEPDGVLTMLSWAKIPKGYKFKTDDEQRKQQVYDEAMEEMQYAIGDEYGVPYDDLIMRPKQHHFMPDNDLKQMWLNDIGVNNVAMVFDDRNQVVDMWRKNGLTTFQVADGDF